MKRRNAPILPCLTAMLLAAVLSACSKPVPPASSAPSASPAPSTPAQEHMEPIRLGDGLELTALSAASGPFVEDGSDTPCENMLCATFVNSAPKTLQYAKIALSLNGGDYTFELTTVPPNSTVHAFDLAMQPAPHSIDSVSAEGEYLVFFPEEPDTAAGQLQVEFEQGAVTVTNTSEEDFPDNLYLYYKNKVEGAYLGGITYRVKVGALPAGKTVTGFSSHAGADSELMFVTYGN